MKIGVAVPYHAQFAKYDLVLKTAILAQQLEFDILWFADHVALPSYDIPRLGGRWFETITLMSHISAHVTNIGMGTDVLVAPIRHPVLAAKMLTTLDIVSKGRLIIGVGTGYVKEEIEAIGVTFNQRGDITNECIKVWKEFWAPGNASFQGKHFSFEDIAADPKPVQQPHPPIWVGNQGPRVIKRVAELGDGWHPIGSNFAELEANIASLNLEWRKLGREGVPTLSYSGLHGLVGETIVPDERRQILSGNIEQVIEDIQRLESMGFENILFRLGGIKQTPDQVWAIFRLIAADIIPKVR